MTLQWSTKRGKLLFCLVITFLWGMIAHGYRFYNLDFSHDSLLVFQELDFVPMVSVGRFVQPIYFLLRGNTYAPALVGFLALIFIGVSVYLTADLLGFEGKVPLILLSGLMTVNVVVTLTSATYIHDLDIYMLALLLAVWSAVICRRGKYGFLVAVIPTILSLGLYQSYIQVAIVLHMIMAILALLRQEDIGEVFMTGLKAVASLVIALVLYYGIYQLCLVLTGTAASTDYNSLSAPQNSIAEKLHDLLYTGYVVAYFFVRPIASHHVLVTAANVVIICAAVFSVVRLIQIRRIRGKELALLAALFVLMPFAINLACFLAQGMVHHLMMYAYVFLYILAQECWQLWQKNGGKTSRWLVQHLIPVVLSVILADGVIFANQVYLKKSLEYNTTMTTMNRILDRIEQTEGYVYGETPVAFVGLLYDSPLTKKAPDLDYSAVGLWNSFGVTYPESYGMYIHNVLNYDMEILPNKQVEELAQQDAVKAMGIFPARDSVQMNDGILIVKLAQLKEAE